MDKPSFRRASEAAAQIVNLYLGTSESKALTYGKVLFTIQAVIEEAERELHARLYQPSDN